ncbi:MAG TPA: hypothetical protein VEN95_01130 [Actinomycetota bacterium]|nr:hypothetical protein [Actinomycetota bacterium]
MSGLSTLRDRGTRTDLVALGAVAGGLLAWYVALFVVRGFAYPVGPDGPVYLWWTRLAGHDGLSAVSRPGVPAIALVLQGTLHLPLTAVLSALECVLGAAVGLGAAALVHQRPVVASEGTARIDVDDREHRAAWVLAGVLAGTFAVHLAAGYLANLAFAALFLAAATALAMATTRGTVAAGLLLASAGSAHPLFLLLGVPILVVAAAQAWRTDRAEVQRVAAASVAGCALVAAGALALLAGPGQLSVITSRDGLLRAVGLTDVLRSAYVYRLVHRWTRYVQWASIPLAVYGLRETRGFVRRFLIAWGVVSLGGIVIGLATGLFPADRFITFGYVVPILAAYGVVRLWRALATRRVVAVAAGGGLVVAMTAGAFIAWARQEPFLSTAEVDAVTEAGRYASAAPPGTPLLFVVNDRDATATFLATQAANVIRAALPPDRIRDASVVVPYPRTGRPATRERIALARVTSKDAGEATRAAGTPPLSFLLTSFDRVDRPPPSMTRVADGVFIETGSTGTGLQPATSRPVDPLEPSSPEEILLAAFAVLSLLFVAGSGWAGVFARDAVARLALAPLCGLATLVLAGIALERLGMPLTGSVGPTVVSASSGGGGYLVRFLLERRAGPKPSNEVHDEPR